MQSVVALTLLAACAVGSSAMAHTTRDTDFTLHYAPNHNFDARGTWRPAAAGFDLADVNEARQLRELPPGVKGLIWVGLCTGATRKFTTMVAPYLGRKRVFGFYLMDDPDPRSGPARCKPASLRAEADWIHQHVPGALTFIVLMNLSTAAAPSFQSSYDPQNSHIDLYGLDPYPCRSESGGCSSGMIRRYVTAAEAWGIPRARLVPVYQAFGGGRWRDGQGGRFTLPTAAQLRALLAQWRALISAPVFDYAYSWGSQRGDRALENSADLQAVFLSHNLEPATTAAPRHMPAHRRPSRLLPARRIRMAAHRRRCAALPAGCRSCFSPASAR